MSPHDDLLDEELADTLALDKRGRESFVDRIARLHPAAFYRVRMACQYSSAAVDRDHHAARIVLDTVNARRHPRLPHRSIA